MKRSSTSNSEESSISTKIQRISRKRNRISEDNDENSSDDQADETKEPDVGVIERIALRNFMCHGMLTMNFSNNVNFIVGKNGSGKSAILSGIVVGLGGKTSSTSRGTSLKTLIKEGCNFATIEITLRNIGTLAFKPDVYGNKIIVERRLGKDGTSSYKLFSADRKLISTKKEELTQILVELNIYVDNPLTCLNQEMSKHFLHSKSESDKYKFFMKSTQLEQMSSDYRFVKEQRVKMEAYLKQKQRALPDIEKEVLEKEERFRSLAPIQDLNRKITTLKNELTWANVSQVEVALKPLDRDVVNSEQKLPKFNVKLKSLKKEEAAAQVKLNANQNLSKEKISKLQELRNLKLETKPEMDALRLEIKSMESARNRSIQQKRELLRDKQEIENKIKEMKNASTKDKEKELREKEARIEYLKQQHSEFDSQHKTVTLQIEQFQHTIGVIKDKTEEQRRVLKENEQNKQEIVRNLRGLQKSGSNKLQLFGEKMPEFVNRIEDAWKNRKFRKKPRGPLGIGISLKDGSLAVPIECALKSVLRGFVVDNHADLKVLDGIKRSVFSAREASGITIYTSTFMDRVYDVSKGRARHNKYKTVLDLINVQDPVITNCLIDIGSIETILVVPTITEALDTMQVPEKRPKNSTKAFTIEGDEVYPDRFYSGQSGAVSRFLKADVQDEVRRLDNELTQVERKLDDTKSQITALTRDLKQQEVQKTNHNRQMISVNTKLRSIMQELRKLEVVEEEQILDLHDLEDEVTNFNQQIITLDKLVSEKSEMIKTAKDKFLLVQKKWNEYEAELDKMRELVDTIKNNLEKSMEIINRIKSDHKFYLDKKEEYTRKVNELRRKRDEHKKVIEEEIEKAKAICPERIETRRSPNNLRNEINQIQLRIQQEESMRGQREQIIMEFKEVSDNYKLIRKRIAWLDDFIKEIGHYSSKRNKTFLDLQKHTAVRCRMLFDTLLNQRGFKGQMIFDHKNKQLYIHVQPGEVGSSTKDMKALSGGERSFSTVCFVLTLWEEIQSPFRCLDEFDVFMDMANRRVSMEMMIEIALTNESKQFIFLTPLDISSLPRNHRIRVWKMQDPDRRQTNLPFESVSRHTQ